MGIQGLIPFLKKSTRSGHISDFSGQCVAVDAYCWLHKGAYACVEKLAKGEPCKAYVTYCMKFVNMLLSHNIKPILVFDGRHLPAKAKTELKRRQSRQENRTRAAELLRAGRKEEASNYLRRSIDITHSMALELMRECRSKYVDCIVAPYEADAQLAYLNIQNIAQVVITEDSDLVLFGCNVVMFKMDLNGNGLIVEREKLHLAMGTQPHNFDFDKFMCMCVLSGCDYLPSLPGIGLAKALKFVTKTADPDIHRALRRLPLHLNMHGLIVSNEYRDEFVQAIETFKYQLVYDPMIQKLVHLNEPPDGYEPSNYIGEKMPDETAYQLALGNLDPFTMKPVDDFSPDKIQYPWPVTKLHHVSIWQPSSVPNFQNRVDDDMKRTDVEIKLKKVVITDTGEDLCSTGDLQMMYGPSKNSVLQCLADNNKRQEDDRSGEEEPAPKKICVESQKENQHVSPKKSLPLPEALSPILSNRKSRNPFSVNTNREQFESTIKIEKNLISNKKVRLFSRTMEPSRQIVRSRYFLSDKLEPDGSTKTRESPLKTVSEESGMLSSIEDNDEQPQPDNGKKSTPTDKELDEPHYVSRSVEKGNLTPLAFQDKENNITDSGYFSQSDNHSTSYSTSSQISIENVCNVSDSLSEESVKVTHSVMQATAKKTSVDILSFKKNCVSVFNWQKVNMESKKNDTSSVSESLRQKFSRPVSNIDANQTPASPCSNQVNYFKGNKSKDTSNTEIKSATFRPLSKGSGSCRKQGLNKKDRPKEKSLMQQNLMTLFAYQKAKQL